MSTYKNSKEWSTLTGTCEDWDEIDDKIESITSRIESMNNFKEVNITEVKIHSIVIPESTYENLKIKYVITMFYTLATQKHI